MPKIRPWRRTAAVAAAAADDDGAKAAALVLVCRSRTGRGSGWQHLATAAFGEEEAGGQRGCGWTRKRGERGGDGITEEKAEEKEKEEAVRREHGEEGAVVRSDDSGIGEVTAVKEVEKVDAAVVEGKSGRCRPILGGGRWRWRKREKRERAGEEGGEGWYGVGKEIKGRDLGGRRTEAKEEKRGGGLRSWRERDGVDTSGGGWRYGRGRRGFRQGSKQRRRRNGGGAGARKGNQRRRRTRADGGEETSGMASSDDDPKGNGGKNERGRQKNGKRVEG